jgi:hypothetical protein
MIFSKSLTNRKKPEPQIGLHTGLPTVEEKPPDLPRELRALEIMKVQNFLGKSFFFGSRSGSTGIREAGSIPDLTVSTTLTSNTF